MMKFRLPLLVLIMLSLAMLPTHGTAETRHAKVQSPLILPLAGTGADGSTFSGTVAVQRFVHRSGQVFAIGIVSGTLVGSGGPIGTALYAPARFPVSVGPGTSARVDSGRLNPALARDPQSGGRFMLARQQQACGVLHLEFGAINLNLLGVIVTTAPVMIDLSGDSAGPLGALVCEVLNTLQSVVGLVALLNQLLGLLTGLLGGLAGGLGGGLPV